jgi:hypothetical protein
MPDHSSPDPKAPDLGGMSIIFVGPLDLSSLHPAWFEARGFLSAEEAESAELEILHKRGVEFAVPDAFGVLGDDERLVFQTNETEWFETVRDAALVAIRHVGDERLTSFGVNRAGHWQMDSRKDVEAVFDALIQPDKWGFLSNPAPKSVFVRGDGFRGHAGAINIRVEPSVRVSHGLYITVNYHFELRAVGTDTPASIEMVLDNYWNDVMLSFEDIAADVLKYGRNDS